MNHSTILRRSKAHRAAAVRNAQRLESIYLWRLTIRVPRNHMALFRDALRSTGARLRFAELDEHLNSQLFHIEVPPGFEIDRSGENFTIVKEERVRRTKDHKKGHL